MPTRCYILSSHHCCSSEYKASKAALSQSETALAATNKEAAAVAALDGLPFVPATPRSIKAPALPPAKSVLHMSREEARLLGVPWFRMAQVRHSHFCCLVHSTRTILFRSSQIKAALAEDMMTLSLGVPIEMVPRRYLQWVNKPQRNRITADFAGLHSQVMCISVSPDNTTLALGFKSSQVHLIDAGTGEVLRELTVNGHAEGVTCLSFSGDGMRLASGSHDSQLIIWDAITGSRLALFEVHTGR